MELTKRWAIDTEITLDYLTRKRLLSIIYGLIFGEVIAVSLQKNTANSIFFGEAEKNLAATVLDNMLKSFKDTDKNYIIKNSALIVALFGEYKSFEYIKDFLEEYLKAANFDAGDALGVIIYVEIMYRLFHYDDYDRSLSETALACKKHLSNLKYKNHLNKFDIMFNKKKPPLVKTKNDVEDMPYWLSASIFCCRNNDTFEKTLLAVSDFLPHDPMIGSITGALAGIYYQIDKIPVKWIDLLGRKEDINLIVDHIYTHPVLL